MQNGPIKDENVAKIAVRSEEILRRHRPTELRSALPVDRQRRSSRRQPSAADGESKEPFSGNEAGMLLKTKDRCGKLPNEPGMFLKTNILSASKRECY